jgi:osmotically-inducible protein OsmY
MKSRLHHRFTQTAFCVAVSAAVLSGCAPLLLGSAAVGGVMVASDRRTSGIQLEDEGIELRAVRRLREQWGDRGNINVVSFNRQVLITGEVPTEADKITVEQLVSKVDNVRGVFNELAVLGASSLTQRSSDALVSGRVKAALLDTKDLSYNAVKVVTERGTVYLMGRVTQREAARATDVVRVVQGVQRLVRLFEIISQEELEQLQPKPALTATPGKAT